MYAGLVSHTDLQRWLVDYGYIAVFALVAIESIGVPLPGKSMLIVAAVYAGATGKISILGAVAVAAAGAIVGDNLGYAVGRSGGWRLLRRYGRYVRITDRRLKLGRYLFMRHGGKGRLPRPLRRHSSNVYGASGWGKSHGLSPILCLQRHGRGHLGSDLWVWLLLPGGPHRQPRDGVRRRRHADRDGRCDRQPCGHTAEHRLLGGTCRASIARTALATSIGSEPADLRVSYVGATTSEGRSHEAARPAPDSSARRTQSTGLTGCRVGSPRIGSLAGS
jgi:hypothetical protein